MTPKTEQEIKESFDRHTKEHPPYVLCLKGTDLKENNHLKIEIDPYNVVTISDYLNVASEEERDNRIRLLINFLVRKTDEIATRRVIEYLTKKYDFKERMLERMASKTKKQIEQEQKRPVLKINNYLNNVESFYNKHPFFYDRSQNFWMWNAQKTCYEICDEIDIMNAIEDELKIYGDTIGTIIKSNYLEAFKRLGRKKIPKDAPKKWIQFKDKAFSLTSKKIYGVTSDYFFCNPIPWELGTTNETPTMNKLFTEWVGLDYLPTLYEVIAYCCYTDYPIHIAVCLIGAGRNGKSQFQKLLFKFLGKYNVTSTELDAIASINNKFESFKLYKKLCGLMSETNFGILNQSSMFKKLTGGDLIGFEQKHKTPFEDFSYATLIINSNSLPTSEDTSEGFYRRWLIIDFPNSFPEGKDIIKGIPDEEYRNLARKVTEILPDLLERGKFSNQGTISERKRRYIAASNPLTLFIEKYCVELPDAYIRYSQLYTKYCQYLKERKKRQVSKKEFSKFLDAEGFEIRKTSKEGEVDRYVEGIRIKEEIMDFSL